MAEFIFMYFYLATGLLISFVYVHFQCTQVSVHVHSMYYVITFMLCSMRAFVHWLSFVCICLYKKCTPLFSQLVYGLVRIKSCI